ncbi:MAG: FAD:protein FMN transferase [Planctomycetota bacterium]
MVQRGDRQPQTVLRLATEAMGTRFEFVLVGDREQHLRAAGEEAIEEVRNLHQRFSLFRSDSLLSLINRAAAREAIRLDDLTFGMFKAAAEVHAQSGGAFDLTLAREMRQWGLHTGSSLPEDEPVELTTDEEPPGMLDLRLDPDRGTIAFRRAGVTVDLGSIAKGHALDIAAEVLRAEGVEHALLHGGTSSIIAFGAAPSQSTCESRKDSTWLSGWPIAIRLPGKAFCSTAEEPPQVRQGEHYLHVCLRDTALAVSALHGRVIQTDVGVPDAPMSGEKYGHIIDPRTRRPLPYRHTLAAVSGASAMRCDAWSTAFLVFAARCSENELEPPKLIPAVLQQLTTAKQDHQSLPDTLTGLAIARADSNDAVRVDMIGTPPMTLRSASDEGS